MDRLSTLTAQHTLEGYGRGFTKVLRTLVSDPGAIYKATSGPLASYAKAATAAMTTGDAAALQNEARPFLQVVERQSILSQINPLSAPTLVALPTPSDDPAADWIAEGANVPVQRITFTSALNQWHKFGFILPITLELARSADDRGLAIIERLVGRALRKAEDRLLLSADAAVAGQEPAGLLFGLTAVGGGSPVSLAEDLELLWSDVRDGDADLPVYIASKRGGQYLAGLHSDGTPLFPDAGPQGGHIHGVRLVTSAAAGNKLILLDAAQLVVSDGGLRVDRSGEASLQMDDAPSAGPQNMVNLYQTNAVGLKFQRFLDWTLTSDDAIGYIELPINGSPS